MQGNPTNLDLLRRTTRADFYAELGAAQATSIYDQVCMEYPSDSDQETYAFFGAIPKPRRVDAKGGGTVQMENLNDYKVTIVNATWKMVLPVRRDIIDDAKLGQIEARARSQGASCISFLDERFSQWLETPGNGYDAVAFFGGSHDGGTGNAHDNTTTTNITATDVATVTEASDAIATMLQRIQIIQDDQNRVANFGGLNLVWMVTPGHERGFRSVIEVGPVAGQTGNDGVFKGMGKVIVNPYLAGTDKVYCFVTGNVIKGATYQKHDDWEFDLLTTELGSLWYNDDLGEMVSRGRFDFGPGDHKKVVRHTFT